MLTPFKDHATTDSVARSHTSIEPTRCSSLSIFRVNQRAGLQTNKANPNEDEQQRDGELAPAGLGPDHDARFSQLYDAVVSL